MLLTLSAALGPISWRMPWPSVAVTFIDVDWKRQIQPAEELLLAKFAKVHVAIGCFVLVSCFVVDKEGHGHGRNANVLESEPRDRST